MFLWFNYPLTPMPIAYTTHDKHFILQALHIVRKQITLLNTLHGKAVVRTLLDTSIHDRIGARAQCLLHFLLINTHHQSYKTVIKSMLDSTAGLLLRDQTRGTAIGTIHRRRFRRAVLDNPSLFST